MKTYLKPIYENVKSYYNKAVVETDFDGENMHYNLYSYGTLVLSIKRVEYADDSISYTYRFNQNVDVEKLFSNTTLRHIKEFINQCFYTGETKITKQWLLDNQNKDFYYQSTKFQY